MDVWFCAGQVVTKPRAVATHFLPPASRCASGGNTPMWSPQSASVPGFSTSTSLGGARAPLGTLLAAALCQNTPCRGARDGEGLCRANIWSAVQMECKHSDDDECIYAVSRLSRLRVSGCVSLFDLFSSYFLVWGLFSPPPLISDVYTSAFSTCTCVLPASQPRLLFFTLISFTRTSPLLLFVPFIF